MPLNDRQIKAAKPSNTGKKVKLFDGNSLYLEITPAGGKIFRMRYRMNGKDKDFTIGKYPAVSLVEARQATENARRMIAQGQDPTKAKQEAKAARQAALLNTLWQGALLIPPTKSGAGSGRFLTIPPCWKFQKTTQPAC